VKAEGERSLRLDVLEPARYAYGFHVRQEVKLPPSERLPDRLDLSLRLRGEKLDWVRFEIVPAFPTSGAPLATRVVNLEPGEWTRAELSLPIPPRLEFGFVVRFNGPVGARLWLDDASPLPVTYDTVHEEWPRLVLARAFLDTLLDVRETAAAASEPERERVASAGLRDPGFEDAPLEANPNVGWSCHAASTGEVDARFDLDQKLEGRRSLMLRVKKPRALGRHFLSRILPPPAALSDEREGAYSVALRAETKVTAVIAIGYWADGSTFHTLAQRSCRLEPRRWARHEVRFQIPPEARSLGLYVYLPNEAGDRVWVDAVRLERVK